MSDIPSNIVFEKWKETMTNYQFNYLIALKDKATSLEQKNDAFYQLVKSYVEAGKTPEEILAGIEALMES